MDLIALKEDLGLGTSTDHDTLLQQNLDAALRFISGKLGYSIASHSVTQQSVGSSTIPFTDLPVSSLVVKYREDLTATTGTSDVTLTLWTDYYPYERHIELLAYRCSTPRIILTYSAGYSALPTDIEQAACEWVKYHFKGLDKLQAGEIADTRIPRDINALLEPYMRLQLP
jgi:hypothetical protein